MALTITQLSAALRIGDGQTAPPDPILSILTRQLGVAQAFVELIAENAPDAIKDEAVIRMAGYLYDAPPAGPDTRYADAWRNSGAASLVARWVVHRLGDATGLPSTPAGAGVDESAVIELIRVHQEMADAHFAHAAGDAGGNGETPTPATPTPPVVLVDGELYNSLWRYHNSRVARL